MHILNYIYKTNYYVIIAKWIIIQFMLERDVGKETIKEGQKEVSAGEGKKAEDQKEEE